MNKVKFLPYLLASIFLFISLLVIDDYGINWDEPVHFMRGQAYWRLFLTGKKDYSGLPKLRNHYPKNDLYVLKDKIDFEDDQSFRRSLYQADGLDGNYFLQNDAGHPPLNGILAAATNWLLYQKLGLLGDVEAYHFFSLFLGSVLVSLISLFALVNYGPVAGLVSGLSLALYPLFLAESHFNIKDPVETFFFSLTILTFWQGVRTKSARWFFLSSILAGFALGTKFNLIFAPLIILPWLSARYWSKIRKSGRKIFSEAKKVSLTVWLSLFSYPLIVFLIFFGTWPYLWQAPRARFIQIVNFYKTLGLYQNFQSLSFYYHGFNTYPVQAIIFTTPPVILFFALAGIIFSLFLLKKEKEKTAFLILLWFFVPILRVTIPGTSIYGGLRQIMEYIPAMALLAGLGAQQIVKLLSCYLAILARLRKKKLDARRYTLYAFLFFSFLPLTLKLIQLHPNEDLYFNPLIGGFKGAVERNFPHWGVSLGNEHRQAIEWINKNARAEAQLVLARGVLSNIPRIWIRKDINFGDHYFSGESKEGEYIIGLVYEGWESWIPERAAYLKKLTPIFEKKVDGVTIFKIWQNQ